MYTPQKKLGQNFLKDQKLIQQMIRELEIKDGDELVEIGPGLGAITVDLIEFYGGSDVHIKAVEIDPRFVEKLKHLYWNFEFPDIKIIEADILEWLPQYKAQRPLKIIGSLPYYITSPILHNIIKMQTPPEICVLLIQKEVAHKIVSQAPRSSYLSTFIQTFYKTYYLTKVDKGEFSPSPKVDGGVIKMVRRDDIGDIDVKKYEGFLHKAYSNPRKMLNKMFYQDELNRAQLDSKKRAQEYNWDQWIRAFKILV